MTGNGAWQDNGPVEQAQKLLRVGADPNYQHPTQDYTALHAAALRGNTALLKVGPAGRGGWRAGNCAAGAGAPGDAQQLQQETPAERDLPARPPACLLALSTPRSPARLPRSCPARLLFP